jgi:hypothetical protein
MCIICINIENSVFFSAECICGFEVVLAIGIDHTSTKIIIQLVAIMVIRCVSNEVGTEFLNIIIFGSRITVA